MASLRRSRFVVALIAMFSMFYMQLAVAGYVCPETSSSMPGMVALTTMDTVDESMPNCHEMDIEQPNLCSAHAQFGDQSLDKPELPPIEPFIAGSMSSVVHRIEPPSHSALLFSTSSELLERITAPPPSIQNCCFRI